MNAQCHITFRIGTEVLLIWVLLSLFASAPRCATKDSPIAIMEQIYRSNDPEEIMHIFLASYDLLGRNPELYREVLEDVVRNNDKVNISALDAQSSLSEADRVRLAIRVLARCILRMGDIDKNGDHLIKMWQLVARLPDASWNSTYFHNELYSALAKNSPELLLRIVGQQLSPDFRVDPPTAMLAVLQSGHSVDQIAIKNLLGNGGWNAGISLLYYLQDSDFKLAQIEKWLSEIEGQPYIRRCWRERELINALASFPEGERRLEKMREAGRINFIRVSGIYFGTLSTGITVEDLRDQRQTFLQAASYILESNRRFGGAERILYVDITPDEAEGKRLNPAGWGFNSLYITYGCLLNNSPRVISFILAHEACEQRISHGSLTTEIGLSYVEASRDGTLEDLRLGRRIGGKYIHSGLGHPWDSEREWLAESASALIIGEEMPLRVQPALKAVEGTFRLIPSN